MDKQKLTGRTDTISANLRDFAEELHERNKQRIKVSTILLFVCPVVLGLIRVLTGSDKVFFMLLWLVCTFGIAIYMIGTAYYDDQIQKKLGEVTDKDADFDGLIPQFHRGKEGPDEEE